MLTGSTVLARFFGAMLATAAFVFVGFSALGQEEKKSGTIIGELKSQKNSKDGKNTTIEVLAPGEEKPRSYYVLYDPKIKGPIESVLKDVRAAKAGDTVEFEWVQTGHGPAIKSFKVLKKSTDKQPKPE